MHRFKDYADSAQQAAALADPNCPNVLLPMRANGAPEPRLSLTAPVLTGARHLHLLIKGHDKRAALAGAQTALVLDAPVKNLLGRDTQTIHYTAGEAK